MNLEGFRVGEDFNGNEGSWFFGILIPVISDAAGFLSGLFTEFLDVRSCYFNSFGFDSKDSDDFDVGHERYVL
jgi:hypothetical protein